MSAGFKIAPEAIEKLSDIEPNTAYLVALSRKRGGMYGGFEPQSREPVTAMLEIDAHRRKVEARRRANKLARRQRKINAKGNR